MNRRLIVGIFIGSICLPGMIHTALKHQATRTGRWLTTGEIKKSFSTSSSSGTRALPFVEPSTNTRETVPSQTASVQPSWWQRWFGYSQESLRQKQQLKLLKDTVFDALKDDKIQFIKRYIQRQEDARNPFFMAVKEQLLNKVNDYIGVRAKLAKQFMQRSITPDTLESTLKEFNRAQANVNQWILFIEFKQDPNTAPKIKE